MIDGPTKLLGRVGFGLAAIGQQGQVNALAYGVPSCWVDTVPGAEAWAIYEALKVSVPGTPIWSDCEGAVNRLKNGRAAATGSAIKLARFMEYDFRYLRR